MKKLKWLALIIVIIGIIFLRSKIEDRNQKEANIIENLEDDQSYESPEQNIDQDEYEDENNL